jgi:hypothetical protein
MMKRQNTSNMRMEEGNTEQEKEEGRNNLKENKIIK